MGGKSPARGEREVRRAFAEREKRIAALARRQHGVLSRRQLLAAGLSTRTIERRREAGRLFAVHGGVYAVGHDRLTPTGQAMAAVLACGEGAVLSHRNAAAIWGIARSTRSRIEVTAAVGRRRPGILVHESGLAPEDRTERVAIPITSVSRTLFDLAEVLDMPQLERAWEEADRLRLLELGQVEAVCSRAHGRRGLKRIRPLLESARAPVKTRSPLEDFFARFYESRQLPMPAFNVTVLGHEVDALWPREKLIVEADSYKFHRHRAAFERDRRRDTERQAAGYRVLRVTHRRLAEDSESLAVEIRALLDRES
jgi:very-short-patch-repair endonuclease